VRKQQRDLYADLDRRLKLIESGAALAGGGSGAEAPAAGAQDEQAAYNRAFERLKAGEYGVAITQFRDFMTSYPNSALLDNAQYWIGEAYYVTRDYDQALAAFRAVGERWPNSRKSADALLKLGYTQFEKKQLTAARGTLQQVQQRFPGSDAARLAGERLARLPPEGR
jgi:tol-pal system protein YbgF